MTTHRRYQWVNQNPWDRGGHQQVLEFLELRCERVWWFREPAVEGEPFGRMSFSFIASGRDQWWCHRRAYGLAIDAYYHLGCTEKDLPEPTWVPLPPHENRGYRYQHASAHG